MAALFARQTDASDNDYRPLKEYKRGRGTHGFHDSHPFRHPCSSQSELLSLILRLLSRPTGVEPISPGPFPASQAHFARLQSLTLPVLSENERARGWPRGLCPRPHLRPRLPRRRPPHPRRDQRHPERTGHRDGQLQGTPVFNSGTSRKIEDPTPNAGCSRSNHKKINTIILIN